MPFLKSSKASMRTRRTETLSFMNKTENYCDRPVNALPYSGGQAVEHKRGFVQRLMPALARRSRLVLARLFYRRVQFGAGCDIRPGLNLVVGPRGRVHIGSGCILDRQMTIEAHGDLVVGACTIFGHHCTLASKQEIIIGEDCLIAEMVSIRDHNHRFDRLDIPVREQGAVTAPIYIGRNVWLASKVTVVKGVSIGDNAIVGANAVVTKDIPPNAIAVGIPARVIRMRGDA
jgi:acetyltransferase-like isoleucine patch superfamily enzyme